MPLLTNYPVYTISNWIKLIDYNTWHTIYYCIYKNIGTCMYVGDLLPTAIFGKGQEIGSSTPDQ